MSTDLCPAEDRLLAVLAGDGTTTESAHVAECEVCRGQLRKFESEATVLQRAREQSRTSLANPSAANVPGVIGKFIVVGIWDDNPDFTTYRGLHAVVRRDVLIQVAKSPLSVDATYQDAFRAACGTWMQPRPHVAQLLDAGEHQSRPFFVVAFNEGVRLDRLTGDDRLDVGSLLRILALVAQTLAANPDLSHPRLTTASIVLDEANQPELIDWAAAREFVVTPGNPSLSSTADTARRLAVMCCAAFLTERSFDMERDSQRTAAEKPSIVELQAALQAKAVPNPVAEMLANAVLKIGALPTLAEIAHALPQPQWGGLWAKLLRAVRRNPK